MTAPVNTADSPAAEEWRFHPVYGGHEISSLGRIRSWLTPNGRRRVEAKLTKTPVSHNGYPRILIRHDGQVYSRAVSALVLETYRGPCPPGMEACHDPDPTRTNCSLANLRWDTRKNNHADKIKHGTVYCGTQHHKTSLTSAEVAAIRAHRGWLSGAHLADLFGTSKRVVSSIQRGDTWKYEQGERGGACYVARGESAPTAKLTERQALEVLSLKGRADARLVARHYGISRISVYQLWSRRTWKHLVEGDGHIADSALLATVLGRTAA